MDSSRTATPFQIFVSYRHEGDGMAATLLVERLTGRFGEGVVFKDADSIAYGDDFAEVITDVIGRCVVLLALIGQRWLTITDKDGRRRLDNPEDFVRIEIEAALNRDIRLIPVLIEETQMPREDEVPPSLVPFVRKQAFRFSSAPAGPEFNRLVGALNSTLTTKQADPAGKEAPADTADKEAPANAAGEQTRGTPPIRRERPGTGGWFHRLTRRRVVLPAAAAALVAVGLLTALVVLPGASGADHGWPYQTEGAVYTRPTVVHNVVYFGSADGHVYAVNANSGALIWKYRTGGQVYSRPGVASDAVYVGSNDGHVYALSTQAHAQRRVLWEYPAQGAPGLGAVRSSPILANGVVYFGSENGRVYAVSAGMGRPAWPSPYVFKTGGKVDASPIQSPDHKTIYIASEDGHIYALQAGNGALRWEYPAPGDPSLGPFMAQASLSSQGDIVYIGSDNGHVYALSTSDHPAHRLLWTHQTAAGVDAQPTVWQGNVYVASGDYLYAWTAGNGSQRWNPVRLPSTIGGYDGPVVANGVVYVGSGTGLYAFDATRGTLLWHRTVSQVLSPPVVNDGNIYVGTRRGVYALTFSGSRVT